MERNVAIAAELGYLHLPAGLLRPLEELVALAPERQVILSTGSQGEPNSALALMAAGEHKYASPDRDVLDRAMQCRRKGVGHVLKDDADGGAAPV